MNVHRRRGWERPEGEVTDERLVLGRRAVLAGAGLLAATRNVHAGAETYPPGRTITPEADATTYNNFYEFGTAKDIWPAAQKLVTSPWQVRIDGLIEHPRTIGVDDLLRQVQQEQRVYRHRCVEAWAMTVPWSGFPLAALVRLAAPASAARYVVFETAQQPRAMPGLRTPVFPWPYVEGVTMEEAQNELAFVATGLYGKPLPPQNGAPLRLVLPWKYGFKSIKSIVRVGFTAERPVSFWEQLGPDEYGFWANVNPAVPHPRWSQASERLLGSDERVPTRLFNGYGEWVAGLYTGKTSDKLYM